MQEAALALSTPLVSGKDSMKNDFRGKRDGEPVTISVPPTLLMTAVAKVSEVRIRANRGFQGRGRRDLSFGRKPPGLLGSELQSVLRKAAGLPNAKLARAGLGFGPSDLQLDRPLPRQNAGRNFARCTMSPRAARLSPWPKVFLRGAWARRSMIPAGIRALGVSLWRGFPLVCRLSRRGGRRRGRRRV